MHHAISWILLASAIGSSFVLWGWINLCIYNKEDIRLPLSLQLSVSHFLDLKSREYKHRNQNSFRMSWACTEKYLYSYLDKSLFIWNRKHDSWNLVTTASFFSFWTLKDTISWSVYLTVSAGLSEHTGRKGQRARIVSSLIVKPLVFSPFQRSLTDSYSTLSEHSIIDKIVACIQKFRLGHHLLIYRGTWSAVTLVAMI